MPEIIDLSQDIYSDMPVFSGHPQVSIRIHSSHDSHEGSSKESAIAKVCHLSFGDHTGSHVDSISHMGSKYSNQSIDRMPLSMFYTEGICLDLSAKLPRELIEPRDLIQALKDSALQIKSGDTVLLYTDHYRRAFGTEKWADGPGISAASARWLGDQHIAAFGVETMSPGVRQVSNKEVHEICGELGFTHYENLVNLHQLIGRGRFRFIGLPLKLKGATASPVRAVAVFE